ncbi:hypothetical protein H6F43_20275 [Leptolyngbya sp. FACHB-36]|uniref:hypothetical protein n=1 Tax=Leptolyngbya sp. FACHB-36 TaxID=2692808 RepID=UPI0016818A3A|nr:hypothetical protein [Leptolyngbya sp. FACHB-36]MBD2022521.1 hypothetical protein [Leptolyngbya sp. FACHB-36]
MTDYVLFIHGVKTRHKEAFCSSAKSLFQRIMQSANGDSRDWQPIFLFWGDLNTAAQTKLREEGFKKSSKWKEFWFQDFRTEQILEFVGDAALYLSRHVGSQVVERLANELGKLQNATPDDRLHLVTHSWGTVILFDILFASRWDDKDLDDKTLKYVDIIRRSISGLEPEPPSGVRLASIHTMGSPIALFNLINVNGSSHDLTPQLKELLRSIYQQRGNKPLPWRNFSHPGDPIAYPLEQVIPLLLDSEGNKFVQIEDIMIRNKTSFLMQPFSQTLLPLINGGKAHGSYWDHPDVPKVIGEVVRSSL